MSEPTARDFGRLEAEVEMLKNDVAEMKRLVQSMHTTITEAKGGWRVMVMVGGAGIALGGLLVKFIPEWLK